MQFVTIDLKLSECRIHRSRNAVAKFVKKDTRTIAKLKDKSFLLIDNYVIMEAKS